jgi:hypothetical protein
MVTASTIRAPALLIKAVTTLQLAGALQDLGADHVVLIARCLSPARGPISSGGAREPAIPFRHSRLRIPGSLLGRDAARRRFP